MSSALCIIVKSKTGYGKYFIKYKGFLVGIMLSPPGLVCCAGNNRKEFFAHALSGDQSGIKPFVTPGGRNFLAGLVDTGTLSSPTLASLRLLHMSIIALEQIRPEVEIAIATYGPERVGVCAGSCDNGSEVSLPAHRSYCAGDGFPPFYTLKNQSASRIAEFIADSFGIKGPCLTVATACASSAGAIVKGAQLIESGLVDAVIAGGADLASETVLLGFAALEAVSDQICNPFSKNRKGITLGEGAAFFVLKKNEPQTNTSADIELLGWGESADAHHMTAPRPDGIGARAAMEEALQMAEISPGDVDYINLHGTGTLLNDSMEALAIQAVFADKAPPLSSTKPISGHTLGAAGALELALCREALTEGGLPAHCWDGQLDEKIPRLNFVAPNNNAKPKICMSNSFAFGGCNTSLIIGRRD
jgi:3-oxoacyl-[acyl-carrier-protein] synthase-1